MLAYLKTLASTAFVLAVGALILWFGTDGGTAFTAETARRVALQRVAREVPGWTLQDESGSVRHWPEPSGRYLVVDFMYTRCASICKALGSGFQQLQRQFPHAMQDGRLQLVSLTIDHQHDLPEALHAYRARYGGRSPHWAAVRPTSNADARELMKFFGVIAIADGLGGYTHNAAYHVIDPQGRLVAIYGLEALAELKDYLDEKLGNTKI